MYSCVYYCHYKLDTIQKTGRMSSVEFLRMLENARAFSGTLEHSGEFRICSAAM